MLEEPGVSLSISRVHFPVTTLGPGNRIGIWFQGCGIQCPGCISKDTWARKPANTTVSELLEFYSEHRRDVDGLTITGGEPLEQSAGLLALLSGFRRLLGPGADFLVYSGRASEEVLPLLASWTGLVDAVIAEPYIEAESQTGPLVGSDNQRLFMLTRVGQERFLPYVRPRDARDDRLDLMDDQAGGFWMAGIPRRGDMERLRMTLAMQGTLISTSQHIQ
jgi:anaerobic ribonucleoside-triphosphate reductase activating protein